MEEDIVRFLTRVVFPPGGVILLFVLGLLFWNFRPRLSRWLITLGTVSLMILSMPITSAVLMSKVEPYNGLRDWRIAKHEPPAQAIVVLAGGRHIFAPEYMGKETVSTLSLVRLRYGAKLHRDTGLPVLLSGGNATNTRPSEASVMAEVLKEDFNIKPRWLEEKSSNTAENAKYSWDILSKENIDSIILVSSAWHLHRAVPVFEEKGFHVLPGPTMFEGLSEYRKFRFNDFVPEAKSFMLSYYALHELVGRIWYMLRH